MKKNGFFLVILLVYSISLAGQNWIEKNEDESYTARHECAFVQIGDKFLLFGGRESAQVLDLYDYTTDTWANGGMAPVEFNHLQAVTYEGLVWVIGAFKSNTTPELNSDYVYMYNPATLQWIQGMEIPASRKRGANGLVNYNGKFYMTGGNNMGHNDGFVPYFDEFDPATGSWTSLEDAPHARDHFQTVVFNDKLYAIGGRRTGGISVPTYGTQVPEIDIYDFTTETWSTLDASKNLPFPRSGLAVNVFEGEIFTMGGETTFDTGTNGPKDAVEAFNPITEIWTTKSSLNYNRHGIQSIVSGDAIYVVAGAYGGGPRKQMEYYGTYNPTGSPSVNSTFEADETTKSFMYTMLQGTAPIQITLSNSVGTTGTYIDSIELTGSTDYTLNQSYDNRLVGANSSLMIDVTLNDTTKPDNNAMVVVTYNNGSTLNISLEGTLDVSLSVSETENIEPLILYPNPTKRTFSLSKDASRLSIYDVTGKLTKEFKGNFNKGETFDVTNLSPSLYFVKIEVENSSVETSKLIKI